MATIEAITFDLGDTITDLREGSAAYEARGVLRAGRVYEGLAATGMMLPERTGFCRALAGAVEASYLAAVARQQGLTVQEALQQFFADSRLTVAPGLLAASAEAYSRPGEQGPALRLGALATLAALHARGLRLGVISNTIQPGRYLDASLERGGLLSFFSARTYSSEVGVAKPHPQIFRAALAALDVAPERAVHVGDRLVADVAGAQSVGMRAILIAVPQRVESDPHIVPDGCIADLPDLPAVLATLR